MESKIDNKEIFLDIIRQVQLSGSTGDNPDERTGGNPGRQGVLGADTVTTSTKPQDNTSTMQMSNQEPCQHLFTLFYMNR